ncbi:MAG: YihA family ribosome biogenesis GTP-binding protein [Rhodothermales bacterium]|nr:YihA family ribosome biogenesis GTP-binding protein [Rhodothermales bacterium]MBO6779643.1 YihA family ribosome biogenesis GTP-binding protein [Rhodothermales bacterium]
MKVTSAKFDLAAPGLRTLPAPGRPEIALIGRSNVGKSSLLNRLVNRKSLARTSGQPGKTREFNFYLINEAFYLVDLPGFGYARVSKKDRQRWQKAIGGYMTTRESLRLVLHLVDGRHEPTKLDLEVMSILRESHAAYAIVMTKGDKLSGNERGRNRKRVQDAALEMGLEIPVILTSAKDGRGKDEVMKLIGLHLR